MYRILVVEDEEGIRKNIERLLSLEGYEVATAHNGQHGLVIAHSMLPDIILTDINMPVMDGFEMLEAIRNNLDLDRTVVIMLTAAEERASMRKGMSLGADDSLTKPIRRGDLLDSIATQLRKVARFNREKDKAIALASAASEDHTRAHFRQQFSVSALHMEHDLSGLNSIGGGIQTNLQELPHCAPAKPAQSQQVDATVFFADIHSFTTLAERLSASELATLLRRYFELACPPIIAHGGTHLKLLGDGLLALFLADPAANKANKANKANSASTAHAHLHHSQRACLAALSFQETMQGFKPWVLEQYGARGLPSFNVCIGLHTGDVTLSQIQGDKTAEVSVTGDNVQTATQLQAIGKNLGWTFIASLDTADLIGEGLQRGRQDLLNLPSQQLPVGACEVLALTLQPALNLPQAQTAFDPAALQNDSERNSQMTARAAKEALKESLGSLNSSGQNSQPQSFRGYQILRKLGEGGMSDVYLAHSAALKKEVVLKVLRTSMSNDAEMLRRFIQEYAVLANMHHHHVSRIYDQGFTDDYAYIAMEYLAGGTLKQEIRGRNTPGNSFYGSPAQIHHRVIELLRQVVSALHAIHKLGLVYRDLKPDNLMYRSVGGELVLVDFGIVKNIGESSGDLMEDRLVSTEHGQVIGTPYYVSPEQAIGQEVSQRSDFYSLGVMLYEMLTGERPYRADSLNELLARHLHAEIPRLPPEHRVFQALLSRLMAKNEADRPEDALEIWRNLEKLATDLSSLETPRLN